MHSNPRAPLVGAICAAFLASALPAEASLLSSGFGLDAQSPNVSSVVEDAVYGPPAGKRCLKWTRRWNTRHGIGVRRCVQWR
jgi:hypothetical protein